jgi:3-(3-hydroxy-phenyl)propionate hydroxylase
VTARYLGKNASALYLLRPDQVVAARWLAATPGEIDAAHKAIWEATP